MRLHQSTRVLRQAFILAIAFTLGAATIVQAGPTISGFVGLIDGSNTATIDARGQLSVSDGAANAQLAKLGFDGSGNLRTTATGSVSVSGAIATRRQAAIVLALNKQDFLLTPTVSDLDVGAYTELALDASAGTFRLVGSACCGPCAGTLTIEVSRKGADGTNYAIDSMSLLASSTASRSYGVGAEQNVALGSMVEVRAFSVSPTAGCAANYRISVIGK